MPKNKGKGGKNRKRGKNENIEDTKRELIYKDEGQDYAQVIRMLGGGHVEAFCYSDGRKRVCHIRGKLRKKVWINKSDIILIGLRYFEEDKADVITKYTSDEVRELQKRNELPININLTEGADISQQETGMDDIYFNEEIDSDELADESNHDKADKINGNLNRNDFKESSDENEEEFIESI